MKIRSCGKTDVGLSREHNEDAFLINDELGLYIVCDGMGGHAGGEIASTFAIEKLNEFVVANKDRILHFHDEQSATPDSVIIAFIEEALRFVAESVHSYAAEHKHLKDMGTTLTAMLVFEERAVLGHVGDSRCYLIRDEKSVQLTDDHTVVAKLVQRGIIPKSAAMKHQFRHVLSQSIGSEKPLHIDTLLLDIYVDDLFILCSDGLIDYLEDEHKKIESFVQGKKLHDIVDDLITFANMNGGKDNITVLAIKAFAGFD